MWPSGLIGMTMLGAAGLALAGPARAAEPPPMNLLVIHVDQHNFRTLGCYRERLPGAQALMWGPAVVETPHLDWLAQHGAMCMNFYATTPLCSPSRAAFVSGRYPQNTPVVNNNVPLNDGIITFAGLLQRAGYATGYAGKWHLNGPGRPEWAPARHFGFDDNRYMFNRGHWKQLEDTPAGPRVKAMDARGQPTYALAGADEKSFTTDFLAAKAVAFIQAHRQGPFCYMLSIPDPHTPVGVRPPYAGMYQGQAFARPRTAGGSNGERPVWDAPPNVAAKDMAGYYGMVRCIDDNVGKILDALRAANLMQNTVIVYTSDHGDMLGEHGLQDKRVPYDGAAKVPFLVYAPGRIKAGTVIWETLGCVDFMPTIVSLLGFKTGGQEEGRDASALLTTGRAPAGWKDVTFMRGPGHAEGWLAAVTPRYKLIYSSHVGPWLLDRAKDPDELVNCFGDPAYRETIRDLSRALSEYGRKYGEPRIAEPAIKADLAWAVDGRGAFQPAPRKKTQVAPGGGSGD